MHRPNINAHVRIKMQFGLHENPKTAFSPAVMIRLVSTLRATAASLETYDRIMEWHFRETGELTDPHKLSDISGYVSRDVLFKKLRNRYKMTKYSEQITTKLKLPYAKSIATIVHYDAKDVILSLLTDPRIRDEDYLFFGDDPLGSPPDKLNFVEDLNTGSAYRRTWQKLITKPGKQILLPVIFYIDAANTGHFADLPITAVKISLGIFTRKARDKDHFWRILGYIPAVSKHKSRGRRGMTWLDVTGYWRPDLYWEVRENQSFYFRTTYVSTRNKMLYRINFACVQLFTFNIIKYFLPNPTNVNSVDIIFSLLERLPRPQDIIFILRTQK